MGTRRIEINLDDYKQQYNFMNINVKRGSSKNTFLELSQQNYIYGPNGSGKTTLAKILENYANNEGFEPHVYYGFSNIIGQNEQLDAITLGKENIKAVNQIKQLDDKIKDIKGKIDIDNQNSVAYLNNLDQEKLSRLKKELDQLYTQIASKIREKQINGKGKIYDRSSVRKEISKRQRIEDSQLDDVKKTAYSTEQFNKLDYIHITLPSLGTLLQKVNSFLISTFAQPNTSIPGIDNAAKKNFALQGMKIHKRGIDKVCAFCGNKLTEKRWKLLATLMNNGVATYSQQMKSLRSECKEYEELIGQLPKLDESTVFVNNRKQAKDLQIKIDNYSNSIHTIINKIKEKLTEKAGGPFSSIEKIEINGASYDREVSILNKELKTFIDSNNKHVVNQQNIVERARTQLRRYYLAYLYDEYGIGKLQQKIKDTQDSCNDLTVTLKDLEDKLNQLLLKRQNILNGSTDESTAVKFINNQLRLLGNDSFQLCLVKGNDHSRGTYAIYSNKKKRSLSTLSRGEKNIVAFLYFIEKIRSSKRSKPLFIIFDDPMDSNDISYQFTIYSCIKRVSLGDQNNIIVVLTHNITFYLNVRPYNMKSYRKKVYSFIISRYHQTTEIRQITQKQDDLRSNLDNMWDELKRCYDINDPGLMGNCARRLITTFSQLMDVSSLPQLAEPKQSQNPGDSDDEINETKALTIQKTLNVLSHEDYDTNYNPYNPDCRQILQAIKSYFELISFDSYYKKCCIRVHLPQDIND